MKSKYLIRFDDICPSMNWDVWDEIESILLEKNIKPIIAIIPDNHDSKLEITRKNDLFWERARKWQEFGWTIGLHGYQHILKDSNYGLIPISKKTEFVGDSFENQLKKLTSGIDIMKNHRIYPKAWIAPAHSFDINTMRALKKLDIQIISDGFHLTPHKDKNNFFWIPQQLWKFRKMLFGVWTVCYHHNSWGIKDISKFKKDVNHYGGYITSSDQLYEQYSDRAPSLLDKTSPLIYIFLLRIKKYMNQMIN